MDVTRRQFIIIAAGAAAAACAGCERHGERHPSTAATQPATGLAAAPDPPGDVLDAGSLSQYAQPGVYDQFREQGFFIIHRDKQLFVLSSVCTHKGCKVKAQDDQSFLCKCHGSRFDANGHVTKGPAQRDLPRLQVTEGDGSRLLIRKLT